MRKHFSHCLLCGRVIPEGNVYCELCRRNAESNPLDPDRELVKTVKEEIEKLTLKKEQVVKNKKTKKQLIAHPRTNFILATYYKGTGLEEVTKKLEEYLDDADKTESNIKSYTSISQTLQNDLGDKFAYANGLIKLAWEK